MCNRCVGLGGRGRNLPTAQRPCLLNGERGPLPAASQAHTVQSTGVAGRTKKCHADRRGFPAVLCCCLFPEHRDPPTGLFLRARHPPAVGGPASTASQPLAKLLGSLSTELHSRNSFQVAQGAPAPAGPTRVTLGRSGADSSGRPSSHVRK